MIWLSAWAKIVNRRFIVSFLTKLSLSVDQSLPFSSKDGTRKQVLVLVGSALLTIFIFGSLCASLKTRSHISTTCSRNNRDWKALPFIFRNAPQVCKEQFPCRI